jgi:hypothetical protein
MEMQDTEFPMLPIQVFQAQLIIGSFFGIE